jgi:hypothetical protein
MEGSVLDSVHLVKVIGGLYPFQSSLGHAARSEFYLQVLMWIEMTMVAIVDHKLQMVKAPFFPYSYLMKVISSAGYDCSFPFHGWWSSDVLD